MTIEPFVWLIALLPVAAYLTLFGAIRLSNRPMVTTGGRDTFAVAIAISGCFMVGPAELFFPSEAGALFGPMIWPVLMLLYLLLVILVILSSRPKLIVYGLGPTLLTEPLLLAAKTIDPTAICDADAGQIQLPASGIHLRIDGHRGTETAEVTAYESVASPRFWRQLLRALRAEIASEGASSPGSGVIVFAFGIVMVAYVLFIVYFRHNEIVQGFREWLWR